MHLDEQQSAVYHFSTLLHAPFLSGSAGQRFFLMQCLNRSQGRLNAVNKYMALQVLSAVAHLLSFVHWLYTAAGAATAGCMCPVEGTESPAQQLPWALHHIKGFLQMHVPLPCQTQRPTLQVQTLQSVGS